MPRPPKTSPGQPSAPKAGATRGAKPRKTPVKAGDGARAKDAPDGEETELEGAAAGEPEDTDGDGDEGVPASVSGARDSEPVAAPDDDAFAEPRESDAEVVDADADAPHSVPLSRDLARATSGSMERLDPMAAYLREIQRHPLLTPEQTHELAVKFVEKQDPSVAARLVTSNLRLVGVKRRRGDQVDIVCRSIFAIFASASPG